MYITLNVLNRNFNSKLDKFAFKGRTDKSFEENLSDDDFYQPINARYHSLHNLEKISTKKKLNVNRAIKRLGNHSYYKGCKRKTRYKSKADAQRATIKLHKIYPHKEYGIYECDFCLGWHLYTQKSTKKSEHEYNSKFDIIG